MTRSTCMSRSCLDSEVKTLMIVSELVFEFKQGSTRVTAPYRQGAPRADATQERRDDEG